MRKLSILSALLILLLAGAAFADEDYDAGLAALKAKKYGDAAAAFQRYAEKMPAAYQGHLLLGQALLAGDQAAKAVPALRKANELKAGDAGIQLALGRALALSGNNRDACAVLAKIDPSAVQGQNQTVLYQVRASANCGGDNTADLKKIAQAKNDATSWAAYGVAELNNGDVAAAVSALDKAVGLAPNDVKIRSSHVSVLVRQARTANGAAKDAAYRKALGSAQKLSQVDGSFDNLLTLGEVQLGAKEYNAAVTSFRSAVAKNSSDWLPHYYIGQAYTASAQYPPAVDPLNTALRLAKKPDDQKKVYFQLGFVYEKQKNYADSILNYEKAGDTRAATRVKENRDIEKGNKEADEHNKQISALEAEQERLKKEMQALPGGAPPPR